MRVRFKGHKNLLATNRMTMEVTREDYLTLRGDCIVGILADSACKDLPDAAKAFLTGGDPRVRFVLSVEGETFEFLASGSSSLTLTHPVSMVIRKSTYTCSRTLAVKSSAAASDVPRSMVRRLASGAGGELAAYPA